MCETFLLRPENNLVFSIKLKIITTIQVIKEVAEEKDRMVSWPLLPESLKI